MTPQLQEKFLQQLDSLIDKYSSNPICEPGHGERRERADFATISEMAVQTQSVAERVGGMDSTYHCQARDIVHKIPFDHQPPLLLGVLKALREDVAYGHLQTVAELIHADVFSDFLDQADHLLTEDYKTPATVIAGVSLEIHLRALCHKHSISTEFANAKGDVKPKKASMMNDDLAKAKVYAGGDQKQVTAWLDKRNKAAHGEDAGQSPEEIKLMIDGIRNFLVRYPA